MASKKKRKKEGTEILRLPAVLRIHFPVLPVVVVVIVVMAASKITLAFVHHQKSGRRAHRHVTANHRIATQLARADCSRTYTVRNIQRDKHIGWTCRCRVVGIRNSLSCKFHFRSSEGAQAIDERMTTIRTMPIADSDRHPQNYPVSVLYLLILCRIDVDDGEAFFLRLVHI